MRGPEGGRSAARAAAGGCRCQYVKGRAKERVAEKRGHLGRAVWTERLSLHVPGRSTTGVSMVSVGARAELRCTALIAAVRETN